MNIPIINFKFYLMLKKISNLGSVLSKAEQQIINGGRQQAINEKPGDRCNFIFNCPVGEICICGDEDCTYGTCKYD